MVLRLLRSFFPLQTFLAFGLQKRALCGLDKGALQAEGLREGSKFPVKAGRPQKRRSALCSLK